MRTSDRLRPSSLGRCSMVLTSSSICAICSSFRWPSSTWVISRPQNRTDTLTLFPCFRKSRAWSARYSRSCSLILGVLKRISFSWVTCCFLRDSFTRLLCSYLYLPKSMILQTGGRASGETSTRSRSAPDASCMASPVSMMPTCSPSALITRTWGTRIIPLTLTVLF